MSTSVSTAVSQHLHRQPHPANEEYLPVPSRRTASPIILATCSVLPRIPNTLHYRPISPSWQMHRHKPSLSLQGVSYKVFPSPAKHTPSRLPQSQKTLLPLIAKFEVMDVLPSSSDVEKDKLKEGLKLRRTYREMEAGLEEKATPGVLNIKERTAGLRNRVLGLLERADSRNCGMMKGESEERKRPDNRQKIDTILEDCRESQRGINDPGAPKTNRWSHSRQCRLLLTQENPKPSASETYSRIGLPTSNSIRDSILRQQGVSKIRNKIWYFDESPEDYPEDTYFKDFKKKTNDFSEQVSSENLNERLTLQGKKTRQLRKATGRETSRPTSGPEWRCISLNSVDCKDRNPVQSLPSGHEFSPVREIERGRTREPVPRPGSVEPFHPTLIHQLWNSQNVAKTPVRTTSKETRSKIGEIQVMDNIAGENKVTIGEVRKSNKPALGYSLKQFLPPKTEDILGVTEGAALFDEKATAVMSQTEENSRVQLKPRGESLVRERIRQFSHVIVPTASASTSKEVIPRIIASNDEKPTEELTRQCASGSVMSKIPASTDRQTPKLYTQRGTEPCQSLNHEFGRGMIDTVQHRYVQRIENYNTPGNVSAKEMISAEKEGSQLRKTAATQTLKTNVGAARLAAYEKRYLATLAITKNDKLSTSSDKFGRLELRNENNEARLIDKPAQAKQNRFSTIKSKIKVFEDFAGRKLQRNSSSSTKESKVSVERDATRRYITDLNLMTSENANDFGAPLEGTGRAATQTSRGVNGDNVADQSDLKSKGRIRQWWNNGLEAMPSISKTAGIKDQTETRAIMQMTRAREERAYRRAVRVSPEEGSPKETRRSRRIPANSQDGDVNTNCLNRNERKSQKLGSSLGDFQRKTGTVDGHSSTASSESVKAELCFSSCSLSRTQSPINESSMVVKYSCGDGTSSSTLKLVLEKRSAADVLEINRPGKWSGDVDNDMKKDKKADGRDRKLDPNINFHIVETVIAQCELTQPRPRRLLEIQRMVMLCRIFGKRDRSWSRELQGFCAVADVGFEAVEGNNEILATGKGKE